MLFDLKEAGASVYIQQYAFAVRGRFDMRKLDAAWMLTLQKDPFPACFLSLGRTEQTPRRCMPS